MNAVEINSSFYRPHRRTTYQRWAAATPDDFRFAVKVPKSITHAVGFTPAIVSRFVEECVALGPKLAVLLVQLPPKAAFDQIFAERLFDALQDRTSVPLVCEPRHASWFDREPDQWLAARKIARVAADPTSIDRAKSPGGWPGLSYFRLHGTPRIYYSSYSEEALSQISGRLSSMLPKSDVWCIFDNTALGAAMENALWLKVHRSMG